MPTSFTRSMRSLQGDRFRGMGILLATAAVMLVAWTAWFVLARVAVYETTDRARIEIDRAVHPVESPVAGRVVLARLELGRDVTPGDILVELDAEDERLQLEEERVRINVLSPQIAAVSEEIAAETHALDAARDAGDAALDEARSRHAEAEPPARLAEQEAARLNRLRTG